MVVPMQPIQANIEPTNLSPIGVSSVRRAGPSSWPAGGAVVTPALPARHSCPCSSPSTHRRRRDCGSRSSIGSCASLLTEPSPTVTACRPAASSPDNWASIGPPFVGRTRNSGRLVTSRAVRAPTPPSGDAAESWCPSVPADRRLTGTWRWRPARATCTGCRCPILGWNHLPPVTSTSEASPPTRISARPTT